MSDTRAAAGGGRVAVGIVGKPFGLRGEVYVHPDADLDIDFEPGLRCAGTREGAPQVTLVVAASRVHGGRLLVRFDGVEDRTAAEALRGTVLSLPREDVPLDEDSFWADDLLGREVVDDSGAVVGVVEGTLDGPAHDYLVLARPDGGETLVPAVAELVDIADDRIVVHAIPGLLGDDAEQEG